MCGIIVIGKQCLLILGFKGEFYFIVSYGLSYRLTGKAVPLSTNKAAPVFYGAFVLVNNIAPT